jgi:hypothetical protein
MAEIIPFNRAKKSLQKKKSDKKATENRLAFGRTKAEKQTEKARKDQIARLLDGARLSPDDDLPPAS